MGRAANRRITASCSAGHSITSSTELKKLGETASPRRLAVLRFSTSDEASLRKALAKGIGVETVGGRRGAVEESTSGGFEGDAPPDVLASASARRSATDAADPRSTATKSLRFMRLPRDGPDVREKAYDTERRRVPQGNGSVRVAASAPLCHLTIDVRPKARPEARHDHAGKSQDGEKCQAKRP